MSGLFSVGIPDFLIGLPFCGAAVCGRTPCGSGLLSMFFWIAASPVSFCLPSNEFFRLSSYLVLFVACRGNISVFEVSLSSRLSSLTRSAYRSVFRVCSQQLNVGAMLATMTVLHLLPWNESLSTIVSLLPLNGLCFFDWSRALMHSLSASSDLLISAPSMRVSLFAVEGVCAALRACKVDKRHFAEELAVVLLDRYLHDRVWSRRVFVGRSCSGHARVEAEVDDFHGFFDARDLGLSESHNFDLLI